MKHMKSALQQHLHSYLSRAEADQLESNLVRVGENSESIPPPGDNLEDNIEKIIEKKFLMKPAAHRTQ